MSAWLNAGVAGDGGFLEVVGDAVRVDVGHEESRKPKNLAFDEEITRANGGPPRRLGSLYGVAEENEEGGLPGVRQVQRLRDRRAAKQRGALEVAAEPAGVGGEEQVLEGSAQAL